MRDAVGYGARYKGHKEIKMLWAAASFSIKTILQENQVSNCAWKTQIQMDLSFLQLID